MSRSHRRLRPWSECAKLGATGDKELEMTRYLLAVTYQDGVDMPPMTERKP
ncbi:hypothetical protein NLX86_20780 [Streptomyces sp. A3M-1-3]|uniref:hypothetical protein n=1 Tax=Streptomyces sp. A3M-1-3 TaxID=2962044 RepID=UPI0020B74504|nr:hypothetical protein [Streptomyces sp. A3M-1-3]MCP3820441.1 hypothetical protein [Streptomyces sp. A3M-1-3]